MYILHEFLADGSDFFAEGGTEHHDLLLVRGLLENFLNVTSHVYTSISGLAGWPARGQEGTEGLEHLVALV